MRPNLLRTFLAVARHRNITRAASEVHLAQSSVSDQVQTLEAELGVDLFTRSRPGLALTAAGEALKPYAESILALSDEARIAIEAAAGQSARTLTIGALETIASAKMPRWLSAFREKYPDVAVQLKIGGSRELVQKLERGDIDIAFCFDKGELDARFFKRVVSTEPLVLVGPPDQPLTMGGADLGALAARKFVTTEVGCIYRHLFDATFTAAGVAPPRVVAEVDSIGTIARLVAAGAGLALLPRLAVIDALEDGKLAELSWPGPVQAASLVAIRRRRAQAPIAKQFLASIEPAAPPVRSIDGRPRHAMSSPL
jgi:DNA-binding transcriptional LysR family regulator